MLDDGGHLNTQQLNTFKKLFPKISEDGVYICEDIHTSNTKTEKEERMKENLDNPSLF